MLLHFLNSSPTTLTYSVSSGKKGPSLGWLDTAKCNMPSCESSLRKGESPVSPLAVSVSATPAHGGKRWHPGVSCSTSPPWSFRSGWGCSRGGEMQARWSALKKYKGGGDARQQTVMRGRGGVCRNGPNMEPWGAPARLNIETERQPLSHYRCNEAGEGGGKPLLSKKKQLPVLQVYVTHSVRWVLMGSLFSFVKHAVRDSYFLARCVTRHRQSIFNIPLCWDSAARSHEKVNDAQSKSVQ